MVAVLCALTAQTFAAFPGWPFVDEACNVACAFVVVFVVFWSSSKAHRGPSRFECYVLLLILVYPIWIAFCTKQTFEQPMILGLLAERRIVVSACVIVFLRALRAGYFTLREVERGLLTLVWILWAIYVGMRLFLDPSAYTDYHGFALEADPYPAAFMLQPDWIMFGALYYSFRGIRTKQLRNYLFALALVAGITQQYGNRAQTAGLLVTMLLFAFMWAGLRRSLIFIPKLVAACGLVFGVLYLLQPAATLERLGTFRDAYSVLTTGEPTDDPSANTHLAELVYAFPQIAARPFFGNGRLSRQWNGGELQVRGLLFYPDDNGVIGVIYEGGILGLIFFGLQYTFAVRSIQQSKGIRPVPLLDAVKGFLFYAGVESLFYFRAPLTLFFIALLGHATRSTHIPEEMLPANSEPACCSSALTPA